ncbi:MAG TPA: ACT domain-containing protein [Ilumatobacteraceae bacterium]|nr:ACT domain-containing protein [Ilumatobacteraceae bacterium]
MITIVVRVWMPDRPGALGQVASRIGAVRGDVLAIEILEQGGGRAIDEVTVALPDDDLLPLLTAEVDAVDGVSVESIRIVDPDRTDASLSALALGAAIAESPPDERLDVMVRGIQRFSETDWVAVLRAGERVAAVGEAPDLGWLMAFLSGSEHLDGLDDSAPSDLLWANMTTAELTVAAGRTGNPIHERERVRFSLLVRLADALIIP